MGSAWAAHGASQWPLALTQVPRPTSHPRPKLPPYTPHTSSATCLLELFNGQLCLVKQLAAVLELIPRLTELDIALLYYCLKLPQRVCHSRRFDSGRYERVTMPMAVWARGSSLL